MKKSIRLLTLALTISASASPALAQGRADYLGTRFDSESESALRELQEVNAKRFTTRDICMSYEKQAGACDLVPEKFVQVDQAVEAEQLPLGTVADLSLRSPLALPEAPSESEVAAFEQDDTEVVVNADDEDKNIECPNCTSAEMTGQKDTTKSWNAGRTVGHFFGDLGRGMKKIFRWGWKGAKWIAHQTLEGADAVWDGSKWVARKTVDGSKWLAGETKDLAQYSACLAEKGAKITWRGSQKGVRVVARETKDGTIFLYDNTSEFIRGAKKDDSKKSEIEAAKKRRKEQRHAAMKNPSSLPKCGQILKDDKESKSAKVATTSDASVSDSVQKSYVAERDPSLSFDSRGNHVRDAMSADAAVIQSN